MYYLYFYSPLRERYIHIGSYRTYRDMTIGREKDRSRRKESGFHRFESHNSTDETVTRFLYKYKDDEVLRYKVILC
jgi:hypothetical protein